MIVRVAIIVAVEVIIVTKQVVIVYLFQGRESRREAVNGALLAWGPEES